MTSGCFVLMSSISSSCSVSVCMYPLRYPVICIPGKSSSIGRWSSLLRAVYSRPSRRFFLFDYRAVIIFNHSSHPAILTASTAPCCRTAITAPMPSQYPIFLFTIFCICSFACSIFSAFIATNILYVPPHIPANWNLRERGGLLFRLVVFCCRS